MTAAVDTALARISARRAEIDPRKVVLVLLIALPFAVGWVARKVFIGLWIVASFLWVALADGWKLAGPKGEGSL